MLATFFKPRFITESKCSEILLIKSRLSLNYKTNFTEKPNDLPRD